MSGNETSQLGKAGKSDIDTKLATNPYSETVATQANFLHGAQFRGSAGSDVGTGYLASRSIYLPFSWVVPCSVPGVNNYSVFESDHVRAYLLGALFREE